MNAILDVKSSEQVQRAPHRMFWNATFYLTSNYLFLYECVCRGREAPRPNANRMEPPTLDGAQVKNVFIITARELKLEHPRRTRAATMSMVIATGRPHQCRGRSVTPQWRGTREGMSAPRRLWLCCGQVDECRRRPSIAECWRNEMLNSHCTSVILKSNCEYALPCTGKCCET